MGNIDLVPPNNMHQLCFRKPSSRNDSLENKIKPRPFLDDTRAENINLTSPNNSAYPNKIHPFLVGGILFFGIYDKIGERSGMFWFGGRRGIPGINAPIGSDQF